MSSSAANVRHKLSVSDYYRMGDAGILHEDDRIELIEGDLIEMSPIGSYHAGIVGRLTKVLTIMAGDKAVVWPQNPLRLGTYSEPQPDVMVLKPRPDDYIDALPEPADVIVLIEVADSSIDYDRKTKLPMYARNGVKEVWIIDLNAMVLERYTLPTGDGYGHCETLDKQRTVSPIGLPELTLDLGRILV
jgi:Uma2 family endonuclease